MHFQGGEFLTGLIKAKYDYLDYMHYLETDRYEQAMVYLEKIRASFSDRLQPGMVVYTLCEVEPYPLKERMFDVEKPTDLYNYEIQLTDKLDLHRLCLYVKYTQAQLRDRSPCTIVTFVNSVLEESSKTGGLLKFAVIPETRDLPFTLRVVRKQLTDQSGQ